MYLVLYFLGTLALLGFGGWFASNPDWEPGIGIVTSVAGLLTLYVNDEARKARSKAYWTKRRDDVSRALDRIKCEASNLQHIATAKGYKSESHRKAVEDSSFDLLDRDLSPLVGYSAYRSLVRRILAEIAAAQSTSPKSVSSLLPLVESLEARLRQDQS